MSKLPENFQPGEFAQASEDVQIQKPSARTS